jgi:hypothetical protein
MIIIMLSEYFVDLDEMEGTLHLGRCQTNAHVQAQFHKLIQQVLDKPGALLGMVVGICLVLYLLFHVIFQYRVEKIQAGRYLVNFSSMPLPKNRPTLRNYGGTNMGYWH